MSDTPPETKTDWDQVWSTVGFSMQAGGALLSVVGNYYQALNQRSLQESQALEFDFQAEMAKINARALEGDAQDIRRAGRAEIGRLTLAAGQEMAARRAQAASRNLAAGSGTTAEIQASAEIMKQIDALTIDSNAMRQANAARRGATNERNRALLAGVSAINARATARGINPYAAATNSLLKDGGNLFLQYQSDRRRRPSRKPEAEE